MSDDVFSSEDLDDTVEDAEIRFRYPDGIVQWHQLRPQESVATVLSLARALRPDLPTGDITWRRKSLSSVSKPEQRRVSSLGLDSAPQFNVLLRAPIVSLSLWLENGAPQHRTLKLREEAHWKDVKAEAEYLFCSQEQLLQTAAVYIQELQYDDNGSDGQAIACFDTMKENFNFNDAEFCYPIAKRDWLRISRRYLRPSSPLPFSKDNPPHIVIDNDTEFLKVINERIAEPVSPEHDAMTNPLFVAFIEGVKADSKTFWKLRGDLYLDPDSQEVFPSRWAIPGGPQRHVIALMRRCSRPLHIPVPHGAYLEVFGRFGLRLKMEGGRLAATSSSKTFPDVEHWQISYAVDKFTEDFTAASGEVCSVLPDWASSKSPRRSFDSGLSITSFSPGVNQASSFDCMYDASV